MASQLFAPPPLAGNQGGWPAQGQWRDEDYLRLPDDGKRYEIIEGVLYVANVPGYDHQFTVAEITYHFQVFVENISSVGYLTRRSRYICLKDRAQFSRIS